MFQTTSRHSSFHVSTEQGKKFDIAVKCVNEAGELITVGKRITISNYYCYFCVKRFW